MPTTPIRRIRTVFTGVAGTPYYSNLYFGGTADTPEALTTRVGAFWQAVGAVMGGGIRYDVEAEVAVIDPVTGNTTAVQSGGAPGGLGQATGERMSGALQGLLRLSTGEFIGGRGVRGRIFVPGLMESANNSGTPTSTFVSTVSAAMAALRGGAGDPLVVYSRTNGVWYPVTNHSVWSQFAVLRSRRD